MFQSTHPRGVRLSFCTESFKATIVSIHAPTRGATTYYLFRIRKTMFQSTHPRGVRLSQKQLFTNRFVSIHAPTRGATSLQTAAFTRLRVSIHAPTRGATFSRLRFSYSSSVSIHAPTRGATAYSAKYRILIYKSSHFANINQTITFKVIKSLEFL